MTDLLVELLTLSLSLSDSLPEATSSCRSGQADGKAEISTGCNVADCAGYLALLHFVHGLVHLLLE